MQMITSVIAPIAVIVSAFFGSLVAEDCRRFRDSQGIAAAISGELSSYVEGGKVMLNLLGIMKQQTMDGLVISVTFLLATQEKSDSGAKGARKLFALAHQKGRSIATEVAPTKAPAR